MLFTGLLIPGCGDHNSSAPTGSDGRLKVVCTTNIVRDLVDQIGGERLQVVAIMDGPGIDPHTYTPSPADTNLLTSADVVVYSGLHLEGQMDEAIESLRLRGIPVVCVTGELETSASDRLLKSDEGLPDPHVWFDPELWASCAASVAKQLGDIDADGREIFEKNSESFQESMRQLKQDGLTRLQSLPKDDRILVTAHDAFGYFARCFEFQVEAVQGLSTESEPGLKRINELVDLLVQRKIGAVFTEQSVSDRNIQALISGCQSRGHKLTIGGKLFSDTIGATNGPQATLQTALMFNIEQIVGALQGADTALGKSKGASSE